MSSAKIHTHYDNLKVARDAPEIVIRAAYRSLSQRYHPDKSPSDANAARVMTLINESYAVLSDPERRRRHDEWILREELKLSEQAASRKPPIPPAWQEPPSNRQTATRTPASPARSSGIFRRLAAFVLKILLFSPRLTFVGLLIGGIWFWGELAPPSQKRAPPQGPKPYQPMAPDIATPISSDHRTDCRKISYEFMDAGERVVGTVYSYVQKGVRHYASKHPGGDCTSERKVPIAEAPPTTGVGASQAAIKLFGATAPNGQQWPARAAYVPGYPIDHDTGHSNVKVDNSRNTSAVFVKLVSIDGSTAYPVRQFYLPAGSHFTLESVDPGTYDLRYRDLESGGLSRSESFNIDERRTEEGIEYSEMSMTLYKVRGGNFQTYNLSESEF